MALTVSLVEDNRGLRESLAALLNGSLSLRCVAACATAEEALQKIPSERPDVALVDINLPGMSGIECVAKLKAQLPDLQVLMLTMYEASDLIFRSLQAGASGYLLKNTPAAELIRAVEQVHAGGAPMTMSIARKVTSYFRKNRARASAADKLTPREEEILDLLIKGLYYREIGESLGISLATVRTHVHSVYKKLHVGSRTQAVIRSLS